MSFIRKNWYYIALLLLVLLACAGGAVLNAHAHHVAEQEMAQHRAEAMMTSIQAYESQSDLVMRHAHPGLITPVPGRIAVNTPATIQSSSHSYRLSFDLTTSEDKQEANVQIMMSMADYRAYLSQIGLSGDTPAPAQLLLSESAASKLVDLRSVYALILTHTGGVNPLSIHYGIRLWSR